MKNIAENTGSEKKKQSFGMFLYGLTGALCGFFSISCFPEIDKFDLGQFLLVFSGILICLYAAMLIQIIVHESGHLVFGLATGYEFCSFRIFGLIIIKSEGKLRVRRFSLAGTSGQCLMSPPLLNEGKIPYVMYNLGGVFMNLIFSAISVGLHFLCKTGSGIVFQMLSMFFIILAVVGVMYACINGIPIYLGSVNNDGMNVKCISKSDTAMRCFWIQMTIGNQCGIMRLNDMPAEWFELPPDDEMDNAIVAAVPVFAFSRYMESKDFESARSLGEKLLQCAGVLGVHKMLITSDLLYCELISENRKDVIDCYMSKDFKQFTRAMSTNPSLIRTLYTYELLYNHDKAAAEKMMVKFEKAAKTHPYPVEIDSEMELIALADATAEEKYSLDAD